MAAGHCCGNLVRESGAGHLLGPPGARAGLALAEGLREIVTEWQKDDVASVAASMDWAMDALNDFLML
eukprot:3299856-Pyramimonas_sp.AAC.1